MTVGVAPADLSGVRPADKWFEQDESFDQAIRMGYPTYEAAANGELAAWEESVEGALALVLLLAQFPRNMFRRNARAFATDALARGVADRALAPLAFEAPLRSLKTRIAQGESYFENLIAGNLLDNPQPDHFDIVAGSRTGRSRGCGGTPAG
jgi:hypothetical protein